MQDRCNEERITGGCTGRQSGDRTGGETDSGGSTATDEVWTVNVDGTPFTVTVGEMVDIGSGLEVINTPSEIAAALADG